MASSEKPSIAIIGGGLAGLTLSIGLTRHGISHNIYCSQLDREVESDGDGDEDDNWSEEEDVDREKIEVEDKVENDRKPTTGSKRRAEALQGHGPPLKKSKVRAAQPRI
jgi:flavin-dependent dehydrogenase